MLSQIFISAVPEEFGSYAEKLASALRQRGFSVALPGSFSAGRGTKLDKLKTYIERSDAVICLIGERYGEEPPYQESKPHGPGRYSYSGWEYLIARESGRPVHVFFPEPIARRDTDEAEDRGARDKQLAFWAEEIEAKSVPRVPFADVDALVKTVLEIPGLESREDRYGAEDPLSRDLDPECPYTGLRPFEKHERLSFLQRDELIQQLLAAVDKNPLVTVFGASGSGKTSVLRAGVLRDWANAKGDHGTVISAVPSADPYEGLAEGFVSAGFDPIAVKEIVTPHAEDPDGSAGSVSADVFGDLARNLKKPGESWLIVIDPFEEMFVRGQRAQRLLGERFVASIVALAKAGDPKIRLILTLRDDLFGLVQSHTELYPLIDAHLVRVPELRGEDLRKIIEIPAARHGVMFERGLVGRLIEEISLRPGRLPLLQHALRTIWEKSDVYGRMLTIDACEAIGGIDGSLDAVLTQFYTALNEHEQRNVRNLLLTLVDLSEPPRGAQPVARSAARRELESIGGAALVVRLIKEFEILRCSGPGDSVVELAHEAVIEGWPLLKGWVRDRREATVLRDRLQEVASRWESTRRSGGFVEARDMLWKGSPLAKVEELDSAGDFQRVGGIGPIERRFLEACLRRKENLHIIELRLRLSEAAERWKWLRRRRKILRARAELWQGSDLERALECRGGGQFKALADFNDLGDLDSHERAFLRASAARKEASARTWKLRFAVAVTVAVFGLFAWSWPWIHHELVKRDLDNREVTKWLDWLEKRPG